MRALRWSCLEHAHRPSHPTFICWGANSSLPFLSLFKACLLMEVSPGPQTSLISQGRLGISTAHVTFVISCLHRLFPGRLQYWVTEIFVFLFLTVPCPAWWWTHNSFLMNICSLSERCSPSPPITIDRFLGPNVDSEPLDSRSLYETTGVRPEGPVRSIISLCSFSNEQQ